MVFLLLRNINQTPINVDSKRKPGIIFSRPSVSPELARIAPGFRALSINVIAAPIRDAQVGE
ncbi:hypothetical protein O6115_10815, partial [Salmonella enterica subsp. enterica]